MNNICHAAGAAGGPAQSAQGLTWRGTYGTKLPQDRRLNHKATPPSSPAQGEATVRRVYLAEEEITQGEYPGEYPGREYPGGEYPN